MWDATINSYKFVHVPAHASHDLTNTLELVLHTTPTVSLIEV